MRRFVLSLALVPASLLAAQAPSGPSLTAQQAIERIQKATGATLPTDTVDTIKGGDPNTPVTGIVTTFLDTYDVLERAAASGKNLIVTHEPTFYNHRDDTSLLGDDPVQAAKQAFIREQVTTALGKRTLWAMAGISFLAVYRELFEIILFYEALWVQAGPQGRQAVLLGILAAAVLLAAVGGLILKYSVRLPIGPFFAWTSGVLAALAVVFAGNGIAALQEAGVVSSTAIHFVSAPLLGVYPTVQGLLVQSVGLLLVLGGVLMAQRSASRNAVTH